VISREVTALLEIVAIYGDNEDRHFIESMPCTIGRKSSCDIPIKDPSISSLHATLSLGSDGVPVLVDNNSTNGLYQNSQRVERVRITNPTRLTLGNVVVRITPKDATPKAPEPEPAAEEEPEPPTQGKCYYRQEGREHGPYSWDELKDLVADGTVHRADLVWMDGFSAWIKMELVPGLLGSRKSKPTSVEDVPLPSAPEPDTVVNIPVPSTEEKPATKPASKRSSLIPELPTPKAKSSLIPALKKPGDDAPAPAPEPPPQRSSLVPPLKRADDQGAGSAPPLPRPSDREPLIRGPRSSASGVAADSDMGIPRSKRAPRGEITCPHCWHRFDVEDFLYIARHQSLLGDPVLGPEAPQRFLPSKFNPEGNAIDSAGMSCPDKACPRCHLRIPQGASEQPPLFLSIVGAAASGKSFALTAMIWALRNKLARNFAVSFTDTDAINNQIINECEETLFLNSSPDQLVALRKTELQGELYNQVLLDGMLINLPKPFMFTITPAEHHPHYEDVRDKMSRTLVLYDNAGEHFEPGMDSVDNPTTKHLLHSDVIFFLFDPTQDMRFRSRLRGEDPQLIQGARVQRQEILLTEMINRIKKYSGMKTGSKATKTLVLVVSKADVWLDLLGFDLPTDPWRWEPKFNTCALDVNMIKNVSFAVRHMLERICPEVVSTAESFAGDVLYLPNSALGQSPELSEETGMLGIRPKDINPYWAGVPMLYFFYERGFVPELPRNRVHEEIPEVAPIECKTSGDVVFVYLPGRDQPLQIPVFYMGARLRCPETGVWFDMPARRSVRRTGGRPKRKSRTDSD